MKLYTIKRQTILKTAGTRIPDNPRQWPTEVMKALKNQHSYINLSRVSTKFDRIEPDEKRASGVVILDGKIAIPFTIKPGDKMGKPEICSLDVMFSGEKFCHLNERSMRRALAEKNNLKLFNPKDGRISDTNYVGQLTGDVSPLEYSPTSAGGIRSTAGCGLMSRIINRNNVQYLHKYLTNYRGINSIVSAIGMNDSLENLMHGLDEEEPPSSMKYIFRSKTGDFVVTLPGGDSRIISLGDMKSNLGSNFYPVFKRIMANGWAMVRDIPTMKSISIGLDDEVGLIRMMRSKYVPIQDGGAYRVMLDSGVAENAIVCVREVDFDGQMVRKQVAILGDGRYCEGKVLLGIPQHEAPTPEAKSTLGPGKYGRWMSESFSSPVVTPPFMIKEIISMPNKPMVINGVRMDTMDPCTLVMMDALVNPTLIPSHHRHTLPPLYDKAYYVPAHMYFVEMGDRVQAADQALAAEVSKEASFIRKNGGMYSMWGNGFSYNNLSEPAAIMKMAEFGADDIVVERILRMKDSQTYTVKGIEIEKTASVCESRYQFKNRSAIELFKRAAEDVSEAINEIADDPLSREHIEDPVTMDKIISMQFVSDDTLEELVHAEPLFEEVEDKLAKLLMASRQGEKSINEKAVSKALKGIGAARNSLHNLAIELEDRQ